MGGIEIEGGCAIEFTLMAMDKIVKKHLKLNRVCAWDSIEVRGVFECLLGWKLKEFQVCGIEIEIGVNEGLLEYNLRVAGAWDWKQV